MREQDLESIESLIAARRHKLADIRGKASDADFVSSVGKPVDGVDGKAAKKRKKNDNKKMWNNPLLLDVEFFKLVAEDTDKKFRTSQPAVSAMANVGAYLVRAGDAKISEEAQKLDLHFAFKLKANETIPDPVMVKWLDGLYRKVKVTELSADEISSEQITAAKTIETIDAISKKIATPTDTSEATKTFFVHPQVVSAGNKRSREAAGISEEVYTEYITKRAAAGAVTNVSEIILD
jgi:hypothetical protein